MTVTGERPDILLEDVDFNRRDHPDRPLRPIPPGRDHFADQWRYMREFIFGEWIDIEKELEPRDLTRLRDDYFWQRDELMTGVVEAFERLGHEQGRALFEQALTQGIDTLDDPPQELVDLFEHLDNLPAQFDLESAERGRMLAMSSTFAATTIIRGWAFYETAMTGDISAATGATGRFADDGPRRFIETARVFAEFTLPDIFDRNSDAFQDVVRVRLMHALASKGLRRKWGGDDVYLKFGEPIPVTSLLGFGSGMLLGRLVDHAFGRKLTPQQLEDLAEYSSFSGRLWGGAPEALHSPTGLELIKSLNYVLARGAVTHPPWRAQLVDAIAGPVHLTTLTEALPRPDQEDRRSARQHDHGQRRPGSRRSRVRIQADRGDGGRHAVRAPPRLQLRTPGADLHQPHQAQRRHRDPDRQTALVQPDTRAQEEERSRRTRTHRHAHQDRPRSRDPADLHPP